MTQELSSANTLYYKIVAPIASIGVYGALVAFMFLYPERVHVHEMWILTAATAKYFILGGILGIAPVF